MAKSSYLVVARNPNSRDKGAMGRTDANGRYRLPGLAPGPRKLLFVLPKRKS